MLHLEFEPYNMDSIRTFNGSLIEERIMYHVNAKLRSLDILEFMRSPQGSYLHGFLDAIGPYFTLWIGDLDGQVAPMDVAPTGWTYPNGENLEKSWFWQWFPSEFSQKKLLENAKNTNPLIPPKYFKTLVPMKMEEKHGEIQQIQAIPVMRLPAIMKKCTWTIELREKTDAI